MGDRFALLELYFVLLSYKFIQKRRLFKYIVCVPNHSQKYTISDSINLRILKQNIVEYTPHSVFNGELSNSRKRMFSLRFVKEESTDAILKLKHFVK